MNTLAAIAFACLAVFANAKPSGHGAGVVIQGASAGGVVIPGHGAWGGHGGWGGLGGWAGHGGWGGWAGHGVDAVVAPGVAVVGPAATAAGHGLGLGWGVNGLAAAAAGHGVSVVGPATVPAAVVGPSGTVAATGLYGVGHGSWGHGAHGHHW